MNYEKKYKDTLDRAEKLLDRMRRTDYLSTIKDIKELFPEFQESEDEKIRKDLIWAINKDWFMNGNTIKDSKFTKKDILAWLDRQGNDYVHLLELKAKAYDDAKDHMSHAYNQNRVPLGFINEIFPDIKLYENQSNKPKGKTALEAINEEKVDNANKVEPKFKVGDWIVSNKDSTVHKVKAAVENISNGKYWYDLTDGGFIPTSHESDYRLLSINDDKIEVKKIDKLTEEYNITGIGSKHTQGKLGEMIKNIKPTNNIWHDNKCIPDNDDKEILVEYNLNNSTRPNHLFHDVAPYDSDSKMFHCYSMHLKLEEIIRWAYMEDILQVVNR